jgi:hypothetical protein
MTTTPAGGLEIRPAAPARIRFAGFPGGAKAMSERACLRIDQTAGTLTWTSDIKRHGTVIMRLPDRVDPADLPELHTVCVVSLAGFTTQQFLVFADRSGRAIAKSKETDRRVFAACWPSGHLEPITGYGILITREVFRTEHKLNQRFPGTAPRWYLFSSPYNIYWALTLTLFTMVTLVLLIGYGIIT